jgi:small GTP-binding protein
MPTNVNVYYIKAEQEYHEAQTTEQKLKALKKMLALCPKHKGTEKLQKEIKERIRKLRYASEKEKRQKKRTSLAIKKEGAGQIVFLGMPNSGKSYLLSKLSKTEVEIADYPFTTKEAVVRMIPHKNTWMQGIEIPAIYPGFSETQKGKQMLSLVRNADLIVLVLDGSKDVMAQLDLIVMELKRAGIKLVRKGKKYEDFIMSVPGVLICVKKKCAVSYELDDIYFTGSKGRSVIDLLWKHLGKIAVQTKTKGKGIAKKPVILEKGATVQEVVKKVHKDFLKKFKYAKIWGPSAVFPGQACGFDHELKDGDVVEIFIK